MKPPPRRRRPEPYYKVQYRDRITLSWKDRRKEAFGTFAEALSYLTSLTTTEQLRIIEFKQGQSSTVHEQT
jgi:hypothetical protein